jgi:hypothetical protein
MVGAPLWEEVATLKMSATPLWEEVATLKVPAGTFVQQATMHGHQNAHGTIARAAHNVKVNASPFVQQAPTSGHQNAHG